MALFYSPSVVPRVHAISTDLSSWCIKRAGVSYDASNLTCTVTATTLALSQDVTVSSGETLRISSLSNFTSGGETITLTVDRGGAIVNSGNLEISGSCNYCLQNNGTVTNSGTMKLEGSGIYEVTSGSYGDFANNYNSGNITNFGELVISCSGNIPALYNSFYGNISNFGTLRISTENGYPGARGIDNNGEFVNQASGTVNIESTGGLGYGIYEEGFGPLINYGTINADINMQGQGGNDIYIVGGSLTNAGKINIQVNGTGYGVDVEAGV